MCVGVLLLERGSFPSHLPQRVFPITFLLEKTKNWWQFISHWAWGLCEKWPSFAQLIIWVVSVGPERESIFFLVMVKAVGKCVSFSQHTWIVVSQRLSGKVNWGSHLRTSSS